jgi:hypothetical protein
MSNRIFTQEQLDALLKNPNIEGCSEKSITYSKAFKITAVREWQTGLPPQEIFIQAGLDISLIGSETPKNCLRRWRKVFQQKGVAGLQVDGRSQNKSGGRKKAHWQSDKDKIEYLETQVMYLKAENNFLAKLRKKS